MIMKQRFSFERFRKMRSVEFSCIIFRINSSHNLLSTSSLRPHTFCKSPVRLLNCLLFYQSFRKKILVSFKRHSSFRVRRMRIDLHSISIKFRSFSSNYERKSMNWRPLKSCLFESNSLVLYFRRRSPVKETIFQQHDLLFVIHGTFIRRTSFSNPKSSDRHQIGQIVWIR